MGGRAVIAAGPPAARGGSSSGARNGRDVATVAGAGGASRGVAGGNGCSASDGGGRPDGAERGPPLGPAGVEALPGL